MDDMNITSAKYIKDEKTNENSSIKATIDGQELFVPLAEGNRHYDEIMRQVNAGTLTIEEAD
tara:strand:+ start:1025 stop:1210 length:186 start_codon:yes stop_codon:yes gene_type:complete